MNATAKIIILYQLIISILIILHFSAIESGLFWLAAHLAVILFLWKLPKITRQGKLKWLSTWYPILFILVNFVELHYLVHTIRPNDLDNLLIQIDFGVFGAHPTVWLEQFTFPVLTEYLQLVYSLFYFLPINLVILLILQKRENEMSFLIFIIVYGIYLSYIGYFLAPAIGPRFTLNHLQTFQLQGLWLTLPIRETLNTLENIQRDCFPSGHTEITALTMFYAYKYHKKYFYVLAVIGTSLIFSTVYLRYHYVVDVFGGLLWAGFVVWTAQYVYQVLNSDKLKKDLP